SSPPSAPAPEATRVSSAGSSVTGGGPSPGVSIIDSGQRVGDGRGVGVSVGIGVASGRGVRVGGRFRARGVWLAGGAGSAVGAAGAQAASPNRPARAISCKACKRRLPNRERVARSGDGASCLTLT